VFAASIALALTGFRPSQFSGNRALGMRIAITVMVVTIVTIPLTLHTMTTLEDARLRRAVVDSVEAWDDNVSILELEADAVDDRGTVELLVVGSGDPRPAWILAEAIRDRFDGPVDLRLRYQRDQLYTVSAR
jgi:hypothetical protein